MPGGNDLGEDRQRGLLAAHGSEVETERRRHALEFVIGEPEPEQPLAPLGLDAPGAHRADEPCRGAERDFEHRVVELGIVSQHGDRSGRINPAQAAFLDALEQVATGGRP